MRDYYDILGVKSDATSSEIKTAYRRLSSKFHPDKNGGDKFFEEQFKKIQEAYSILSNENSREKYNIEYAAFFSRTGRNHSHRSSDNNSSYKQTPKPPNIRIFRSNKNIINDGEEITITWLVENTTKVTINCLKGEQSSRGTKTIKIFKVSNKQNIKITIYAENEGGVAESYFPLQIHSVATNQRKTKQEKNKNESNIVFITTMLIGFTIIFYSILEKNSNNKKSLEKLETSNVISKNNPNHTIRYQNEIYKYSYKYEALLGNKQDKSSVSNSEYSIKIGAINKKRELVSKIVELVSRYSEDIACVDKTISKYTTYELFNSESEQVFLTTWMGDVGCNGGSRTTNSEITATKLKNGKLRVLENVSISAGAYIEKIDIKQNAIEIEGVSWGDYDITANPTYRKKYVYSIQELNGQFQGVKLIREEFLGEKGIGAGKCALIVASRKDYSSAITYIENNIKNKDYLQIFEMNNGRIAISIGTLNHGEVSKVMQSWKAIGKIPEDSFCAEPNMISEELSSSRLFKLQRYE